MVGATGKFPEGKITSDDEGELEIAVMYSHEYDLVMINFGKPVAWVGMPPDKAVDFAVTIISKAKGPRHE